MRIRDLLAAESIELNGSATDKKDVLNKMVDLMAKSGKINNIETYRAGVFAREEEGTTGTDNQLLFHIVSRMQSMHRDLQQWS